MTINVFGGGDSSGPAFPLQRSVRLRSSNSAYFNRTLSVSSTSSTICTWSGWVKRGALGAARAIVAYNGSSAGSGNIILIEFVSDTIRVGFDGALSTQLTTTAVYRDPSAWYHIVVAYDSPQATASNRAKLYVNGVQVTAFTTSNYPAQNQAIAAASTNVQNIGTVSTLYFDGYIAEANFIDGQALTPASFGSINSFTGVWQPNKYSGTYGANGYYLNFQDNSNNTAATIGKDSSGNSNNFTPNGISVTAGVTYDSMLDVPTLTSATNANFATLNPLVASINGSALSEANLKFTSPLATTGGCLGTIGVSSGKWYWEVTHGGIVSGSNDLYIGIDSNSSPTAWGNTSATMYSYWSSNGNKANNASFTAYGASYTTNDVIGVALDMDAGTLTFYKNNTSQGTAFSSLSGTYFPAVSDGGGSQLAAFANFGQRPFSYTPPTGFKSLNTYNLPAPTIPNGSTQFAATLYTGTGSALSVSNAVNGKSFQPDFVWIKGRNAAYEHAIFDSIRAARGLLRSNSTAAEVVETAGTSMTSFDSGGFSLGTNGATASTNVNTSTFVAWQWKAGGTAVTNTSGTISSQVSANPSAGFSIVTFTKNATDVTVGHGLGVAPAMMIVKGRGPSTSNWLVYHKNANASPQNGGLALEQTTAFSASNGYWNNTSPTSSVFTVGSFMPNENSVAYCFSEIAGYSKFGSYTGNNATDGTFVYLGFRPRFLLIKSISAGTSWVMMDSARNTYNLSDTSLYADSANSETTIGIVNDIDFLSNGFKLRNNTGFVNASQTYVYAAFAESPFNYSLAR